MLRTVGVSLCLVILIAAGMAVAPGAGAYVYWGSFSYKQGVGRAGLDGSDVRRPFIPTVAGNFAFARGVAADGTHLFWTNHNPNSTTGFTPPVIGRSAADGTDVNQAFTATIGQSTTGMAVSATHIYWSFENQSPTVSGIGRTPIIGGQQYQADEAQVGQPNPQPCGVAVDDTYAYWANRNTLSISRAPLSKFGTADPAIEGDFIPLPVGKHPCGVAVDATHIYWGLYSDTSSGSEVGGTTIGRANKDGSGADATFMGGGNWITGLAVQGDFLYWTNWAGGLPGAGSIGRGALKGGVADGSAIGGLDAPWGVAVDALGPPPVQPAPYVPLPQPITPLPVVCPACGSGRPAAQVRPDFSRVWTTHPVFTPAPWSTPVFVNKAAVSPPKGTVFNFILDRKATVKIAIDRAGPGRKVGRRCLVPTARLKSKPGCQRFTTVVTLTRNGSKGLNHVPFSGRIRGKALAAGRYRAVFTPRTGRVAGKAKTVAFRIVKP